MILKIQIDQSGTRALLYNKDKSILSEMPASKDLRRLLGGRLTKGYFECAIDKAGLVQVNERVEEQYW